MGDLKGKVLLASKPFSNKVSTMQQYMFYKSAQEERPRNYVLDKHPPLRFQPMSNMGAPYQKIFDLDGQIISQYPMHPYHLPRTGQLNVHHHHHPIPLNAASPFFKVQSAHNGPNVAVISPFGGGIAVSPIDGHVVGPFAPRIMPQNNHMTSQLTIFYGGCVNVFDDVAVDKAQAIMSLASKASNSVTPHAMNPRSTAAPVPTKLAVPDSHGISPKQTLFASPVFAVSPRSSLSSPISVTSNTVSSPGSGSNTNSDTPPAHIIQQESPKTSSSVPRAIPQARKASLARFLEKRKERMINIPYSSCSKVNLETGNGFESCNMSSTSSSADFNLSSFQQASWFAAQQKRSRQNMESLSTELTI